MHLSPSPSPASIPSYFSSSSSPRSLLVWGVVVSSWLVPALLPVAAAQTPSEAVVVGVSTGINNVTGQRPARININDLYDEAGLHWDLYVQALDMFQRVDMTEIESYYQIAGMSVLVCGNTKTMSLFVHLLTRKVSTDCRFCHGTASTRPPVVPTRGTVHTEYVPMKSLPSSWGPCLLLIILLTSLSKQHSFPGTVHIWPSLR